MTTLWEIRGEASYYDNDPRMPGTCPVEKRIFVVAENYKEAQTLAAVEVAGFKKKYDNAEFSTLVVVIEELKIATKSVKGHGYMNMQNLQEVRLTIPNGYRLAVNLEQIPADA